jgi:hypothetical protein
MNQLIVAKYRNAVVDVVINRTPDSPNGFSISLWNAANGSSPLAIVHRLSRTKVSKFIEQFLDSKSVLGVAKAFASIAPSFTVAEVRRRIATGQLRAA